MIARILLGVVLGSAALTAADAATPNIIIIYTDDLGYGDVGCYGATRLATPCIDTLAAEGQRFTSGYATSATCTPSRYALMTGEYPWRHKGTDILQGDAALIIAPGRTTLPSIVKRAGYQTGIIGKWHLGLGNHSLDWNQAITPGPNDVGFDESFIMAATCDRVPCVYIHDRNVVGLTATDPLRVDYRTPFPGLPTGRANPELLRMLPSNGHNQPSSMASAVSVTWLAVHPRCGKTKTSLTSSPAPRCDS